MYPSTLGIPTAAGEADSTPRYAPRGDGESPTRTGELPKGAVGMAEAGRPGEGVAPRGGVSPAADGLGGGAPPELGCRCCCCCCCCMSPIFSCRAVSSTESKTRLQLFLVQKLSSQPLSPPLQETHIHTYTYTNPPYNLDAFSISAIYHSLAANLGGFPRFKKKQPVSDLGSTFLFTFPTEEMTLVIFFQHFCATNNIF